MTLVELLVVVMIMVILLGIAVPMMKPQLADRRIREASRQLNAFIANAQARAAASGRSVGVSFSRTDNANSNISYQVYFAETPAPYVGDTTAARAVFFIDDIFTSGPMPTWLNWEGVGKLSDSWSAALNGGSASDIVQVGDLIQFNHSGPTYVITLVSFNATAQLTEFEFIALPTDPHSATFNGAPRHLNSGPGVDGVWGNTGDDDGITPAEHVREIAWPGSDDALKPVPFQIIRKPQRTTAGSLSLPNGTAVILGLSGFDGVILRDPMTNNLTADHHEFSALSQPDTTPVTIMFRPDGSVEQVLYVPGASVGILADTPIHLMIGSAILDERLDPALSMPVPPTPFLPPLPAYARNEDPLLWQNLNSLDNVWVTIGHRTGSITTSENEEWQVLYNLNPGNLDRDTLVQKTRYSRMATASGQSMGGQ